MLPLIVVTVGCDDVVAEDCEDDVVKSMSRLAIAAVCETRFATSAVDESLVMTADADVSCC